MKLKKFDSTELGTLSGILLGGGTGLALFANTGQIIFLAVVGAGASLGMFLGAAIGYLIRPNKA